MCGFKVTRGMFVLHGDGKWDCVRCGCMLELVPPQKSTRYVVRPVVNPTAKVVYGSDRG